MSSVMWIEDVRVTRSNYTNAYEGGRASSLAEYVASVLARRCGCVPWPMRQAYSTGAETVYEVTLSRALSGPAMKGVYERIDEIRIGIPNDADRIARAWVGAGPE